MSSLADNFANLILMSSAWCVINQPTPQARAIAMPMLQMATACGKQKITPLQSFPTQRLIQSAITSANLYGSQILRASDAPLYITGFRVTSALTWGTVVAGSCILAQYWALNRYVLAKRDLSQEDTYWDKKEYPKEFRFTT